MIDKETIINDDDNSTEFCLDTLGHFIDGTECYLDDLEENLIGDITELNAPLGEEVLRAVRALEHALELCQMEMGKHPDHIVCY